MYSVILMMAVTTAPETANHGWNKGGCHGWGSCNGCYSSWNGYSCSGWSSCHGSGHGCWGSGWNYSAHSCSGCAGNVTYFHSCLGGRPSYYEPFSCFGYGIYGGTSYYWPVPYDGANPNTAYGYGYPIVPNSIPRIENKDPLKKDDRPAPKFDDPKKLMSLPSSSNRAQVVIRLPADAKLYANNQLTQLTSAERVFSTPTIESGVEYQYSMKVEYTRDGKMITDSSVVKVRAGETSVVEFVDRAAPTAISKIKLIAPEGAKIFVDNARNSIPTGSPEYKTPNLIKGQEYSYMFRAELARDGKSFSQTQRVVFKGGEAVTVDFMDMDGTRVSSAK